MESVMLKNGSEEAIVMVSTVNASISTLMQEKPMVFYELVMKCRDANHQFFGQAGQDLIDLALAQTDGSIHGSVKNIVLSGTEGDGLDMTWGNPIKA